MRRTVALRSSGNIHSGTRARRSSARAKGMRTFASIVAARRAPRGRAVRRISSAACWPGRVARSQASSRRRRPGSAPAKSRAEVLTAVARAAAFERCEEQIGRAAAGMDDAQRRHLFERFGYPAAFMRLSSLAFAEMSAAHEARELGDEPGALRHAKSALSIMEERDALDGRYASGRWCGWYDRDLIYPTTGLTKQLRDAISKVAGKGNGRKGGKE